MADSSGGYDVNGRISEQISYLNGTQKIFIHLPLMRDSPYFVDRC